jgi:uncharacterized membrane protein YGL010W
MKSLNEYLSEYGESHENGWNRRIHKICVPIIFITIYWLLFSIPIPEERSMYLNMANGFYIGALFFWFRLGWKIGIAFFLFGFFLAILTVYVWSVSFYALDAPFRRFAIILFILAWMGQFLGHKIEGKKPSFLKDIEFLLIGPIWVIYPGHRK